MSVGFPATLHLHQFGELVWQAYDEVPYLVGSALQSKTWRDVDVRLMLPDEVYEKLGFGDPKAPHQNPRWVATCMAFSALGKQMTGLPIDFQIQQHSLANEQFKGSRGALLEIWRVP